MSEHKISLIEFAAFKNELSDLDGLKIGSFLLGEGFQTLEEADEEGNLFTISLEDDKRRLFIGVGSASLYCRIFDKSSESVVAETRAFHNGKFELFIMKYDYILQFVQRNFKEAEIQDEREIIALEHVNLRPKIYKTLKRNGFSTLNEVALAGRVAIEAIEEIEPQSVVEILLEVEKLGYVWS